MAQAMRPAIKKRSAETDSGGAICTMMRAEVKALDQISAKARPMSVDLKSMCVFPKKKAAREGDLKQCYVFVEG